MSYQESKAAIYGLNLPSKCLINDFNRFLLFHFFNSSSDYHQFYIGTCSSRKNNEKYQVPTLFLTVLILFQHNNEITCLSINQKYSNVIFSSYYTNDTDNTMNTSLWKTDSGSLEKCSDITDTKGIVKSLVWNIDSKLLLIDSQSVGLYDVENENINKIDSIPCSECEAGCWDPHHSSCFIAVSGTLIKGYDTRTNMIAEQTIKIDGSISAILSNSLSLGHAEKIRDVDYNPNKPFHIVTGSDDRLIKCWDLRKTDFPLQKVLAGHSHWVTNVKYNKFHDQLILSSSTSNEVNLWNITSISSAPIDELGTTQLDYLIQSYNEHDDSVYMYNIISPSVLIHYSISWSIFDAWVFASLSYDGIILLNVFYYNSAALIYYFTSKCIIGRCIINSVPPQQKYKILL